MAHALAHARPHDEPHDDVVYPSAIPFLLVHLAALGVFWSGVTAFSVWLAVGLYLVRMWAITAGFHRYFSHRSYKTSRFFQFVMAFLGQSSAQRGVIWWAAVHRHHHLHSDTELDIHSPRHMGFWNAHVGWIFNPSKNEADYDSVPDLTKYPEIRFLDRFHLLPAVALAVGCYLVGGWPGLFMGFFVSTVAVYHCTFFINSLAHVVGKQRYLTGDDSRNNWLLALITLGEGWHNNHHHYQSATAQGWRWYEIDISYYVLKALSWVGLVWDLRSPPEKVLSSEAPLGRKALEKVSLQLAATFPVERLAGQAREAWAGRPRLEELTARARAAVADAPGREEVRARITEIGEEVAGRFADSLPELPTGDEVRARAREMFPETPALDEVSERARILLAEAVSILVLEQAVEGTG